MGLMMLLQILALVTPGLTRDTAGWNDPSVALQNFIGGGGIEMPCGIQNVECLETADCLPPSECVVRQETCTNCECCDFNYGNCSFPAGTCNAPPDLTLCWDDFGCETLQGYCGYAQPGFYGYCRPCAECIPPVRDRPLSFQEGPFPCPEWCDGVPRVTTTVVTPTATAIVTTAVAPTLEPEGPLCSGVDAECREFDGFCGEAITPSQGLCVPCANCTSPILAGPGLDLGRPCPDWCSPFRELPAAVDGYYVADGSPATDALPATSPQRCQAMCLAVEWFLCSAWIWRGPRHPEPRYRNTCKFVRSVTDKLVIRIPGVQFASCFERECSIMPSMSPGYHVGDQLPQYWQELAARFGVELDPLGFDAIELEWYFDSKPTCIGWGEFDDACDFDTLACAGRNGRTNGYGERQMGAVAAMLDEGRSQHALCPKCEATPFGEMFVCKDGVKSLMPMGALPEGYSLPGTVSTTTKGMFVSCDCAEDHYGSKLEAGTYWHEQAANAGLDASKVTHLNGAWYYEEKFSCVAKGFSTDVCNSFALVCAGNGGNAFGWAAEQMHELLQASLTATGVHAFCPTM